MEKSKLINVKIIFILAIIIFFFTTKNIPIMETIKYLFIENLLLLLVIIIIAIYALTKEKWQKQK